MANKYNTNELKALLEKGEALANPAGDPSFPIADEEDLDAAIHAVGRASGDHDAIRKFIIGRAKALGHEDAIPDNWNADGSLSDKKSADPQRQMRSGRTFADTEQLVSAAIAKKFPSNDDTSWLWIADLTDDWAVFAYDYGESVLQKVTYTISDSGAVTLGKPTDVQRITTYEPVTAAATTGRARVPAVARRRIPLDTVETRAFALTGVEFRSQTDETASFVGYASTTGVPYEVADFLGQYRETIQPGAFAKTLRESPSIPLLFNHDGMPVASTGAGTMRLSEDRQGLRVEADLDRRQSLANDLCIALERGDLDKMSFSFSATQQNWSADYCDRAVSELQLFDASIVTYPANPTTTAALRNRLAAALGRQGRARLLQVSGMLTEMREGRVLSAANVSQLQAALDALHRADDALTSVDSALDEGQSAIAGVLGTADPDDDADDEKPAGANTTGADGQSQSQGNPIAPPDGAGARSVPASVAATRALVESLRSR